MIVLPIKDQLKINEVVEYILQRRRTETSVDDIMHKYGLTYAEYSMIENLALPAYKQSNEAEAFRAKYNILKSRLHGMKEKWAIEVLREEDELNKGGKE